MLTGSRRRRSQIRRRSRRETLTLTGSVAVVVLAPALPQVLEVLALEDGTTDDGFGVQLALEDGLLDVPSSQ